MDIAVDAETPEDGTNVWEHSGLFEGTVLIYIKNSSKIQ